MTRRGRPAWERAYAALPGTVYALFAANVALSLGNLVWPMFTPLLQEGLGLAPGLTGLLLTLTMVATAVGALAGGYLADRLGRGGVLVVTRGLAAVAIGACGPLASVPGTAPVIAALLVVASLFRGASEPTQQAVAADLTPEAQRPAAFSLLYLSNKVGFVAPLLAGTLFHTHQAWLFYGSALAATASVALVAIAVLRPRGRRPEVPRQGAGEPVSLLQAFRQRPRLALVSLLLAVLSFVHVQHLYALPLQVGQWFGASGARLYGTLLSFNALVGVLLAAPVTALTARRPAAVNLAVGGFFYAAGFGLLARPLDLPWLFASTLLWSLGELLIYTHAPAYLQTQAPPSHRGRIGATAGLLSQAGYALGPGLTGLLLTRNATEVVWQASLLVSLASGAALLWCGRPARLDSEHPKPAGPPLEEVSHFKPN